MFEVARDPTVYRYRARDPKYRMFLHVLNINLDHYDFHSHFYYICLSSNDCILLPAIIAGFCIEWRQTNTITLGVRTFHAGQSLIWTVPSYSSSHYSKCCCGLDNLLVNIGTFCAITYRWSASKNHCHLLLQYHVYSDNCADECLHGISGRLVATGHMSWLLHNNSIDVCCLLLV